jgi:hypothetical protein
VIGLLKLFRRQEAKAPEEKVEAIFEMVREIRDELKPIGPTGERTSRLELLMGAVSKLSPGERENFFQELESLEVDDQIVKFAAKPKTIEEISDKIKRSYGYTANRLRALMKAGKAMRKRDAVTRKYVYAKV